MRKFLVFGFALVVMGVVAAPTFAQTNQNTYHNGIDYFFGNPIVPPTNVTTATRMWPSYSQYASMWGGGEGGSFHSMGVQQDGFEMWNGQAGPGAGTGPHPIAFSWMEFRQSNNPSSTVGTIIALASWVTSLPCSAPWFWIVTFSWGTAFTQVATSKPTLQWWISQSGELSQATNNQNYFTGSGNERSTATGGFSYFQDSSVPSFFQLVAAQEWSASYYSRDGVTNWGRDPSGTGVGFPLDWGTGGKTLHSATSTAVVNPPDAGGLKVTMNQELKGVPVNTQTLVTYVKGPFPLNGDITYPVSFFFGPGDPRPMQILPDNVVFNLGLSLAIVLKTGAFGTNVGLSGIAYTIPFKYTFGVPNPPALIGYQTFGIQLPQFTALSNADTLSVF